MTGLHAYLAAAAILFSLGLYGFLVQPNVIRKLLSLNISAAGVFLMFVSFASRGGGSDPVPHALVLTGIVISVSATAYGIALALRLFRETGRASLDDQEDADA